MARQRSRATFSGTWIHPTKIQKRFFTGTSQRPEIGYGNPQLTTTETKRLLWPVYIGKWNMPMTKMASCVFPTLYLDRL